MICFLLATPFVESDLLRSHQQFPATPLPRWLSGILVMPQTTISAQRQKEEKHVFWKNIKELQKKSMHFLVNNCFFWQKMDGKIDDLSRDCLKRNEFPLFCCFTPRVVGKHHPWETSKFQTIFGSALDVQGQLLKVLNDGMLHSSLAWTCWLSYCVSKAFS